MRLLKLKAARLSVSITLVEVTYTSSVCVCVCATAALFLCVLSSFKSSLVSRLSWWWMVALFLQYSHNHKCLLHAWISNLCVCVWERERERVKELLEMKTSSWLHHFDTGSGHRRRRHFRLVCHEYFSFL